VIGGAPAGHFAADACGPSTPRCTRLPDRPGGRAADGLRSTQAFGCRPIAAGPRRDIAAIEAYADTLVRDVLDALELDTAHVVATSYGGYFAFRGAAAYPDRVGRVVEFSSPRRARIGSPREGGQPPWADHSTRSSVNIPAVKWGGPPGTFGGPPVEAWAWRMNSSTSAPVGMEQTTR